MSVLTIDSSKLPHGRINIWAWREANPMKIVRWAWNKTSENIASFASTVLCKQCIIRFNERIEWTQLTNHTMDWAFDWQRLRLNCLCGIFHEFSLVWWLFHFPPTLMLCNLLLFTFILFGICFESRSWMIIFLCEVFFFNFTANCVKEKQQLLKWKCCAFVWRWWDYANTFNMRPKPAFHTPDPIQLTWSDKIIELQISNDIFVQCRTFFRVTFPWNDWTNLEKTPLNTTHKSKFEIHFKSNLYKWMIR